MVRKTSQRMGGLLGDKEDFSDAKGGLTLRVTLRPFLRQFCGYDFGVPKILHI